MEKNILNKLIEIEKKYLDIEEKVENPNIDFNSNEFKKLNKLKKKIQLSYDLYIKWKSLKSEITEAEEIISLEKDSSIIAEMKKIIFENKKEILKIEEDILKSLVEKNEIDEKNAIFEIKGAVGGDEANIFVSDLFEMYQKYFSKNNIFIEILEQSRSEMGGFNYINFVAKGENVYGKMKYESGVHRVQRVPATESQGRVHTSTATVSVFPEADDDVEIKINTNEIRIDTYRASGAGGQHINKTDSAVRITHLPTNIVVSSQDGRSQHDNKEKAMRNLKNKLYEKMIKEKIEKENKTKKLIIGTSERSEKIRTYNYPQNRITDHRIGLTIKKLDRIMDGGLSEIIDVLVSVGNEQNDKH